MEKIENFKEWLKEIADNQKFWNILIDEEQINSVTKHKTWMFKISLYTENYEYEIFITIDLEDKDDIGNLCCLTKCRKHRAGEGWVRRDLIFDSKLSYESWIKLKNEIIKYELVEVECKEEDWQSNKFKRKVT